MVATAKSKPETYIEEIDWLVNDSAAALGERGANIGGVAGGESDGWDRLTRAVPSVARARRLMRTWRALSAMHRNVLGAFYSRRQALVTVGATAAFGLHARVALLLADDTPGLVLALSNQNNKANVPIVTAARKVAQKAVTEAHAAWTEAHRARAFPARLVAR